ncbi:MAG: glycosyltransferase family 4 protein [Candidatus Methanomethyliaceae archaeon]
MTAKVLLIADYAGCPRIWKMAEILVEAGYKVHILEWDRDSCLQQFVWIDKILAYRFRMKASYGWKLIYLLPIWWCYLAVFCLVKNFDIVQPQNLDNLIPIWLLSRIKRYRIVYDIADFYADAYVPVTASLLRKAIRSFELFLIRAVDATIIVDECRLKQIGFKPRNLYIIYNSPPDVYSKLSSKEDALFMRSSFRIFYGGGIEDGRGLYHLVECCQHFSDVTLIIAGFGSLERHFVNFIKGKKNVVFLGRIPYTQVLNWSMKCDCIVALYDPRIPNMVYASPNKMFEAMMCGKPIIVTAGTNMAEIVLREKCGLVVKFGNVNELRKAITTLKNNWDLAISLGNNGRNAYLKKYSWRFMGERLVQLYGLLIGRCSEHEDFHTNCVHRGC